MSKFLIQLINDEIVHDFAFQLKEAVKYANWLYCENNSYCFAHKVDEKDFAEYIPIGSIEFVMDFYKKYHGIENIKPINIPKELKQDRFLRRSVKTIGELKDVNLDLNEKVFVKSIDKFKDFTEIITVKDIPIDKNLLISSVIDIKSEWRGFIYRKCILDLRCYSGDFCAMPDINIVKDMVKAYGENSPTAYTLDVAVTEDGHTVLIEVHNFFSCGLYGFNDKLLLNMFISTHKEILKKQGGC